MNIQAECQEEISGRKLYGEGLVPCDSQKDCRIYQFENESGIGKISIYQVFPGIELIYNDFHMNYYNASCTYNSGIIEINYCREGRYECEAREHSYVYLSEGDLAVSQLSGQKSVSFFPLNHYHGITIVLNFDQFPDWLDAMLSTLSIDMDQVKRQTSRSDGICSIIRNKRSIDHIFSELYSVEDEHKAGYLKVKVLELLLFISSLDFADTKQDTEYFTGGQIVVMKEIQAFITKNVNKHYTLDELSKRFGISQTLMKRCFKGVYGSSIYAYLRSYRIKIAAGLLRDGVCNVTEAAGKVGYSNPAKFTAAFKKEMGMPPTAYQKSRMEEVNHGIK